ncbi:acyl-CoA thioesterase [Pseudomonas aeruginosa]|uniref:acyl-CoA thioesterase n=3 Tax=Pseudomonas aeruginosa TaxID=287 RepID=UPI0039083616
MATAPRPLREQYLHFQPITTRWHDNDIYGHVNNVTYYAFFDTAVNTYLIERGGLDIQGGEVIGLVVSSSCDYFAPVAFPQRIEMGLRVARLGNSSVQYELALFLEGQREACAAGRRKRRSCWRWATSPASPRWKTRSPWPRPLRRRASSP